MSRLTILHKEFPNLYKTLDCVSELIDLGVVKKDTCCQHRYTCAKCCILANPPIKAFMEFKL